MIARTSMLLIALPLFLLSSTSTYTQTINFRRAKGDINRIERTEYYKARVNSGQWAAISDSAYRRVSEYTFAKNGQSISINRTTYINGEVFGKTEVEYHYSSGTLASISVRSLSPKTGWHYEITYPVTWLSRLSYASIKTEEPYPSLKRTEWDTTFINSSGYETESRTVQKNNNDTTTELSRYFYDENDNLLKFVIYDPMHNTREESDVIILKKDDHGNPLIMGIKRLPNDGDAATLEYYSYEYY